jgi:hypothetical protein
MNSKVPKPYAIIHFRVGDDCLLRQKDHDQYLNYLSVIKSADPADKKMRFILMSDSAKLKELSKDFIFTLDGPITHIGCDTDVESLKHTVAEFFILRGAIGIFTHSVYFWTSGFVKLINYIYDIPLTNF